MYESLGNLDQAVNFQEQHLSIAASTNDQLAKTVAYSALGRIHQLLGNRAQAVAYLTQGLCIAEMMGRRDEEVSPHVGVNSSKNSSNVRYITINQKPYFDLL